jgi:hypothetical protein
MTPPALLPPASLAHPPCTNRAAQQGLQRAQKALERIQERAKQQPTATELQMELGTLKKDKEEADKLVARVKAQLASAQALRDRAQQQVRIFLPKNSQTFPWRRWRRRYVRGGH